MKILVVLFSALLSIAVVALAQPIKPKEVKFYQGTIPDSCDTMLSMKVNVYSGNGPTAMPIPLWMCVPK